MKLKDGRTYVTRSGVKRKVTKGDDYFWPFYSKSITPGSPEADSWDENGRYLGSGEKHKWDLVREVKKNAK